MKFFYKSGVNKNSAKSMFEFLKNHFTYYTMNYWNNLKSIANCVKVHRMRLSGDPFVALAFLEDDEYFTVNDMLYDFNQSHQGYKVYFNGRSGGYLVLANSNNNCNVLPAFITDNYTYEEFKQYTKDNYGGVKHSLSDLRFYTELVQDFDKMCDEIRDYVDHLSTLDFAEVHLINQIDRFEDEYWNDLQTLGIGHLKVENKEVDISKITLKSLKETLISYLKNPNINLNITDTKITAEYR